MIIILLGAPGAGKGSVSNVLKEKYNFQHISTGDLFRALFSQDTPFAHEVKKIVQSGKLVSDEITNKIVQDHLCNLDKKTNIILDGYPRNIKQLEFLNKLVKVDFALDVQVPKEELKKRITGRRTCPVCKEIYNIYYKKPKVENVCDHDGSALIQRPDDNEETFASRLSTYLEANAPLVAACKKLGIYHSIDNTNFETAISQIKNVCNLK